MATTRRNASEKATAKSAQNRAYYAETKGRQDRMLIRLDLGERAAFDRLAMAVGLSRSALFQLYLAPMASALTPVRLDALHRLMAAKKISLSSAIGQMIDSAQPDGDGEVEISDLARAFDERFGASGAPGAPSRD